MKTEPRVQKRTATWSALQTAAILLLCRLTAFFCCKAPYTAADAIGMAAGTALQCVILLPLLLLRNRLRIPAPLLWVFRGYALIQSAWTAAEGFRLVQMLQTPMPALFCVLFLLTLLYTASRTQAATARTAVLMLVLVSGAFLLLPVSGIRSAHAISLYLPAGSVWEAFIRELRLTGALGLLPLLLTHPRKKELYAPHALGVFFIGRLVILPLLVLFGTMQNGRLTEWEGSPFFLLLARTPLSDALRIDGVWMLYAIGCAVLCVTFFIQQSIPQSKAPVRTLLFTLLLFLGLTALFLHTEYDGTGLGIAALTVGGLLPCACLWIQSLQRRFS